jgi:phage-related tail fiber protein
MSNFYTLLTAIGAAEHINAQAGGVLVPYTHLALGDGNGAATVPTESMSTLKREVHRVPVSSITVDTNNPNWLVIEAVVPTTVGGWTVREIGLVGGTGAGNKLLAVGNFPDTYKPLLEEGSGRDLVVRMIVQVGNASVVQLTVDPSVALATNQSIANAVAAHEAKADPHAQYIKTSQKGVANGVATLGGDGLVPLSQLPPAIATDAELAASLSAHVGAGDPHPQYLTPSEGDAAIAAAVTAHQTSDDPHPQYLTQAELNAQLLDGRARRNYFANLA